MGQKAKSARAREIVMVTPGSGSEQALDESRHAVELVDVIGAGVAGEAEHLEPSLDRAAQELHSHGPPLKHRNAPDAQRGKQPVGALGGAGKRARKDLRVRADET